MDLHSAARPHFLGHVSDVFFLLLLSVLEYEYGALLLSRMFGFLHSSNKFFVFTNPFRGPGSVVCIATAYRLDGPGIESRLGARFSAPVQTGPGAQPAYCTMGTGSFPGGKMRPGHDADPSLPYSAEVKNRVELYLYSP